MATDLIKNNLVSQIDAGSHRFIAKCQSILDSALAPVQHQPVSTLKHKLGAYAPKSAPASGSTKLRRATSTSTGKSDDSSCRTEKLLGAILVFVAILILRPELQNIVPHNSAQNGETAKSAFLQGDTGPIQADLSTVGENPAASFFGSVPGNPGLASMFSKAPAGPQIGMFEAGPGLIQQMVPQESGQAYPQFQQFADPNGRFNNSRGNGNFVHSSQAISGVAQQLQFCGPMMLRQGSSPVWRSSKPRTTAPSPTRLMNHPMMKHMFNQVHRSGLTHYLGAVHPTSTATARLPVAGAMHHYRKLTQAMNTLSPGAGGGHSEEEGN